MAGSYRSKYLKPNQEVSNKSYDLYRNGASVVTFSKSEYFNINQNKDTNNAPLLSSLSPTLKRSGFASISNHVKIDDSSCQQNELKVSSPLQRKSLKDENHERDEFAIFGTTRLITINNSSSSMIEKEKVETISQENYASRNCEIFSCLMMDIDIGTLEEIEIRNIALREQRAKESYSELQSVSSYAYNNENEKKIFDYERLLLENQKLKEKLQFYKNEVKKLKGIQFKDDDDEMEVESMTEITTTKKAIGNKSNFNQTSSIPERCNSRNYEVQVKTEIIGENEEIKVGKLFTNICTDESLQENVESRIENDEEKVQEWMTEYDETYTSEHRTVIEHFFQMFQSNRLEFAKMIMNLLAKTVKSVATQSDLFSLSEKSVNTEICKLAHVYCGDSNSINVSVIEWSRLKTCYAQVKPELIHKYTSPMMVHKNNQSTTTLFLRNFVNCDVEYCRNTRNMCTQSNDYQEWLENRTLNTETSKINNIEQINTFESNQLKQTENQSTHLIKSVDLGMTESFSKSLDNVKYYYTPRFDKHLTNNRLEKYGIQNFRKSLSSNHTSGRSQYLSSRLSRSNYVPLTFSESESSKLTKFNNFMKNAILSGPKFTISSIEEEDKSRELRNIKLVFENSDEHIY